MKNLLKLLPILLLSGCTQLQTDFSASKTIDSFEPFNPVEERPNPVQFAIDMNNCRWIAHEYFDHNKGIHPGAVVSSGVQGGLGTLSIATVPAAAGGAGGEAAKELMRQLGISTQDAMKFVTNCMHDKGLVSGNHVYDPHQ